MLRVILFPVHLLVIVGFVCHLLYNEALRPNPARKAMRPLIRQLAPAKPNILAKYGNAGAGLGGNQPWWGLYLAVDHAPDLADAVRRAAHSTGFDLGTGGRFDPTHGALGPASTRLVATRDVGDVAVIISSDPVTVFGRSRRLRYGRRITPPAGRAILVLTLTLPARPGERR